MTKVQLSLTNQEAAILTSYGSQFGYNLSKTIRFVISKASEEFLKESPIPVYQMSERAEKEGLEALNEYKKGKTTEIKDVDKFFNSL
jgi:hypothetical protein